MSPFAYYNEIDPFSAAWLRNLIDEGVIADGYVDERDIRDICPDELAEFTQHHFFAGIGVWSWALRSAGWDDSRPVWTGSCPCQSFSTAGKQKGFADERHLWPAWFKLIKECKPKCVFGEQVEAAIRHTWLDLVSSDMEGEGYTIGSVVLGAHSVGAPHRRQRLYFVGESDRARSQSGRTSGTYMGYRRTTIAASATGRMADTSRECFDGITRGGRQSRNTSEQERRQLGRSGATGRMADAADSRRQGAREHGSRPPLLAARPEQFGEAGKLAVAGQQSTRRRVRGPREGAGTHSVESPDQSQRTGSTSGFWRDAEWLWCRDGKYRAVEPGTFPLAHGTPNRVGRLRGYGNALCAPVAQAFIESYLEITGGK